MSDKETRTESATPEIVVTHRMIEAGLGVLQKSGIADDYSKADRVLVAEIFGAMFVELQASSGLQADGMSQTL